MPKLIKTRVKTYPDGQMQLTVYDEPIVSHAGESTEKIMGFSNEQEQLTLDELQKRRDYERQKKLWQVRTKIKDYCLSNDFDYFWTITFESNRYNDDLAFEKMQKWIRKMRDKYGTFKYIFIPERHKDGAIHFHGVTGGFKGSVVDSGVKHMGSDKRWHTVYNCLDCDLGHTTLSKIRDKKACASYVTKYVTKDLVNSPVKKGKKKYWCSRGLRLPVVEYFENNLRFGQTPDWTSDDGRVSIFNS